MIPPRFEYFAPSSVDEAVQLLDRFGGEAKVLAGGQSLLPVMKLRLAEPKALIDINRIPDLSYIREDAKSLRIGAITRTIPAHAFYQDTFVTALVSNEILTEIEIPKARSGQGNAYMKLEKRVGDFPIVGVAANLVLNAKGTIDSAGLALTAVGPTALKAVEAERSLVGKAPETAAYEKAAELAQGIASPVGDLRGPADYKLAMVRVLALRALHQAASRARGGA